MRLSYLLSLSLVLAAMSCSSDDKKSDAPAAAGNVVPSGSNSSNSADANGPLDKPCDYYTPALAKEMGDERPNEGSAAGTPGAVGMCSRGGYTFARFEKMSKESFLKYTCAEHAKVIDVPADVGEAACSVATVSLAVYYHGWVVQVGNNELEICTEVLRKLVATLPKLN